MTRFGKDFNVVTRTKGFDKPLQWKEPALVFVNSFSDFFIEEADAWRNEAWDIIRRTPHLTYQILTKRPERIQGHLPIDWPTEGYPNVWLGVSAENQETANKRIPILLQHSAKVRFISAEPLLGPIDLREAVMDKRYACHACDFGSEDDCNTHRVGALQWVITGGESGDRQHSRPSHPWWYLDLINQCKRRNIPVFHKQFGSWVPRLYFEGAMPRNGNWGTLQYGGQWFSETTPWNGSQLQDSRDKAEVVMVHTNSHNADMNEWPREYRVQEFPK